MRRRQGTVRRLALSEKWLMRCLAVLSILPLLIGALLLWRALEESSERKSNSEYLLREAAASGRDPFTESASEDLWATPSPSTRSASPEPTSDPAESPDPGNRPLSESERQYVEELVRKDQEKRETEDTFLLVTGGVSAAVGALSGIVAVVAVRRTAMPRR